MRGFIIVTALTAVSLPSVSLADDTTNLIVTADRVPTKAQALPASVTVISRATIETRGYVTLVDALSDVPGLHIVQSGGPGSQSSVFIRGTNSNQVLVLRDGVPINDPSDPGGAFNFGVDTLNDVDHIEIVRGPLSAVYGSGAIGGVINLISSKATSGLHGNLSIAGGAPRALQTTGNITDRIDIWDLAAGFETNSDKGSDQTPTREKPIYTGEPDGFRNDAGRFEIGVTPFTDTRFSLQFRGQTAKYDYDNNDFDAANATGNDDSLFARLGVTSKLFNDMLDTSLYLTRLQTDRQYIVTLDPADPSQSTENDTYGGRRYDATWNNIVHLGDLGPAQDSHLTFGYEHINDQSRTTIDSKGIYGPYTSHVAAHADSDSLNAGYGTTFFDRLTIEGNVREDFTSLAGDAFTWRTGAVLALPEIDSRLRASYGTSFRAPALFDRYGVDSDGYVGNPNLKPEYGQGFDAGIEHDFTLFTPNYTGQITVTYFNNRIRDLITLAYYPIDTSVNIGSARAQGVESEFTLELAKQVSLDLTYTYTDAQDLDAHTELLRRPKNQGSAALVVWPIPKLSIAPTLRYIGNFADYLVANDGAEAYTPGYSPHGLMLDINITYHYTPNTSLFVTTRNLTNSSFEPASGYEIPRVSFLVGVRTGF